MSWIEEYIELKFSPNRYNAKINDANKLKEYHFPKSLYKYCSCTLKNLANLKNDNVWLSNPYKFNDTYDTLFTYSKKDVIEDSIGKHLIETVLKQPEIQGIFSEDEIKFLKTYPYKAAMKYLLDKDCNKFLNFFETTTDYTLFNMTDPNIIAKKEEVLAQIQKILLVSCFSERNNSILMWSHYTHNHKGFCIEYDFKYSSLRDSIEPVVYSDNIIDVTDYVLYDKILNPYFAQYVAMHKFTDWQYEKEWRLIKFNSETINNPIEVPKPKAIFLGEKISKWYETRIINIAKTKSIPVYKMKMDQDDFKLIPKKIEI